MITVRRGTICGGLSSASEQDGRPTAPREQELSKLDRAKERERVRGYDVSRKRGHPVTRTRGSEVEGRDHEGYLGNRIWPY